MAIIWLTYAWDDNKEGDVDFLAQEIKRFGVDVKLDRWNLGAGKRLWEQIEKFINDDGECDAWVLYATQHSLGSEPCREEFAYALDRALNARGRDFPVIGLFPSPVDRSLIPAGIRTRLYISTTDPDWKERLKAAAEGRSPRITPAELEPYGIQIHAYEQDGKNRLAIEVRPRAGTWSPFLAAIPAHEREAVNPSILHGPRGHIPMGGVLWNSGTEITADGQWFLMVAGNEATPTQSYFVHCDRKPSKLLFGVNGGQPQYMVDL